MGGWELGRERGLGTGERLCWGSVTGEVGVSGEEMELGMCSSKEWAGNRQVLCTGSGKGKEDEEGEGETQVGMMGHCP